jgi:hypothetical protein
MKVAAVRSTRYIYVLLSTYAINLHTTKSSCLSKFIPRVTIARVILNTGDKYVLVSFLLRCLECLTQTLRSAKLWIIPSRVGSYSFRVT